MTPEGRPRIRFRPGPRGHRRAAVRHDPVLRAVEQEHGPRHHRQCGKHKVVRGGLLSRDDLGTVEQIGTLVQEPDHLCTRAGSGRLFATTGRLLARAQAAGAVRPGLPHPDVVRLMCGVAFAATRA